MIREVSFRNFKSLRHVDVELERFTVIVGPNASGKSSILEGLHYLLQLGSVDPREMFCGQQDPILLYSRGGTEKMQISCRSNGEAWRVSINPPLETVRVFPPAAPSKPSLVSGWWSIVEVTDANAVWKEVGQPIPVPFPPAVYLGFNPRRLSAPSYSPQAAPRVEYDGEGLASFLAHMALSQPDEFQMLQRQLGRVIPAVQRVRIDRTLVTRMEPDGKGRAPEHADMLVRREYMGDAIVLDMKGAPTVSARLAGAGTLLVLGLLAVLFSPHRPKLVLLDDIDHGLHPRAQRELVRLLREILNNNPDLQIVATTHSPYLLDEIQPEEVRLTTLQEDGSTACARLIDHPEFERWKKEMSPGELWSMFGESWASKPRAKGGQ